MKKFYYKNSIKQFIENEFFIQKSIPDHQSAADLLFFMYQSWLKSDESYESYWNIVKNEKILDIKSNFFERAEITNSDESDIQFVKKIIIMSFEATFKVCKDFSKIYESFNIEGFDAIDENGVDVSIEKSFLKLSQIYLKEFIEKVKKTQFLDVFKYFETSVIEFASKNKSSKNALKDMPYMLMELLSSMIDNVDDMEVNLDEVEFDSANKNLELLVQHELLFDRLILLAEHLEYQFLESKEALSQFHKVNIIERYDEIAMLEHMNSNNENNNF
ncbi:hypothetical protein EELLY_v1c01000 [Entomoplasma ellychniae]|uniref:Uncharacterized protein n=1 Tax=Entomoplasma ellychniae TaxID=2114 RepID=A0A8E2UAI2_9MOLU|nr:hypothetical protein [Entomoplasma ellychniae]PPE04425.1 hypothetical protein EELLY_v1c01000 [Entomoplasma ellychniae]